MKVAINSCFGGFGLSKAVYDVLGIKWDGYGYLENDALGIESENYYAYRSDKRLIEAIEKIGENKSSGDLAKIKIVDIPENIEFTIEEYDGIEWVAERHRTWQ